MAEYLNRTGSIIVILTLLFLADHSVDAVLARPDVLVGRRRGRGSGTARGAAALRGWLDERRRDKQRRALLAKQAKRRGRRQGAASRRAKDGRPLAAPKRRERRASPRSAPASEARPPPSMAKRAQADSADAAAARAGAAQGAAASAGASRCRRSSLLDAPKTERKIDERELMEGAKLLEEKCREFAVEGAVAQIHPGPVVTTFEFKPDAGVKYGKITGLADDLCLAMQAESVLIDRIPGKSTVGIQIPNHTREQISLRELLQSEMYQRSTSKLTLALGKTIHGEPYVADLATMPHLLIAGSTGTGKSVAINSMLSSILFRATPEEVRLIMIDPKRVELGMYEDIPHLMTPVVVDPKQAVNALRWAVKEMEERYKKLAAAGVRNIEQFNRNVRSMRSRRSGAAEEGEHAQPLAYIVVVIDELADLMMVARSESKSRSPAWRRWRAPWASTCFSPPSGRRWTSSPA